MTVQLSPKYLWFILQIVNYYVIKSESIKCGDTKVGSNADRPVEYDFDFEPGVDISSIWIEGCPTSEMTQYGKSQLSDIWLKLEKSDTLIASCDDCQQLQYGCGDSDATAVGTNNHCHSCNTDYSYWGSGYQQAYGDLQYVNIDTSADYKLIVDHYSSITGHYTVQVYCNAPKELICDGEEGDVYYDGVTRKQVSTDPMVDGGVEKDYYQVIDVDGTGEKFKMYLDWTDPPIKLYRVKSDGSRGEALKKGQLNEFAPNEFIEVDGPPSSSTSSSYYQKLYWEICCTSKAGTCEATAKSPPEPDEPHHKMIYNDNYHNDNNDNNNNRYIISVSKSSLIIMAALISLLLITNLMMICYNKCTGSFKAKYNPLPYKNETDPDTDTEFTESIEN